MLSFLSPHKESQGEQFEEDEGEVIQVKPPVRLVVTASGQLDTSVLRRTEGYMYKKGGVNARGGRRNWKHRWFVLGETEASWGTGYELRYHEGQNGVQKGAVDLSDVEIFCEARSLHKKVKYEFQILLQNGNALQLSCDSAEEREEWVETLHVVAAYSRTMANASASSFNLDGYDPLNEDDEEIFQIGANIASNCQAFGSGLFGAEAGQHGQFVIQIQDTMGQKVTRGGMPITVTISNDECLYYLRVHDNLDGSYFVHYMLYKPDKYQLSIRLNDQHDIFGSPYDLEIMPSKTVPEQCVADGECLSFIHTHCTSSFIITAKDIFGNTKTRGGDPFELGVMGPAQLKSLQDNGNGTYTCTLEAQSPEDVPYFTSSTLLILVTLHGKHISGSPFNATIVDEPHDLNQYHSPQGRANSKESPPAEVVEVSHGRKHTAPPPPPTADEMMQQPQPVMLRASLPTESSISGPPSTPHPTENSDANVVSGVRLPNKKSASINPQSELKIDDSPPPPPPPAPIARTNFQPKQLKSSLKAPEEPTPEKSPVAIPQYSDDQLASMSRLERARLRALQAQAHGGSSASSDRQDEKDSGSVSSSQRGYAPKLSNLQKITGTVRSADKVGGAPAVHATGGKLGSLLRQQNQMNSTPASKANLIKKDSTSGITATEAKQIMGAVANGLAGPYTPSSVSVSNNAQLLQEERNLWNTVHEALQKSEVLYKLSNNINQIKDCFDSVCESLQLPGFSNIIRVVRLQQQQNGLVANVGLYRLLEEFDVVSAYITKKEARTLFALILAAQKNAKSVLSLASSSNDINSQYIDFISFMKYLVLCSIFALSKTATFTSLYTTPEAKVDVMLNKWGFADNYKIKMVRDELKSAMLLGK